MEKIALIDDGASFNAMMLGAAKPTRIVLFAVGSGGNPERHLPLLTGLADHGCAVIAPYFERLISSRPTDDDLLLRSRRLRLALDFISRLKLLVVGI